MTEDIPWANPRARHTIAFEQLVAWWTQRSDRTTVAAALRVAWETVTTIIGRVVAEQLTVECGTVFAEGIKQQLVSDTTLEPHWASDSPTLSEDAHDYTTTRYTPQHTFSNGPPSETLCGLCTLS